MDISLDADRVPVTTTVRRRASQRQFRSDFAEGTRTPDVEDQLLEIIRAALRGSVLICGTRHAAGCDGTAAKGRAINVCINSDRCRLRMPDHAASLTIVTKPTKRLTLSVVHTLLAVLSDLAGVFALVLNSHHPY